MSTQATSFRCALAAVTLLLIAAFLCLPVFALAQTSVTLTWTQNTEADLAGYEFHRAFIDCASPNAASQLQPHVKVGKVGTYTETLPPGTKVVCYALKAFDTSNNFSALSNLAGKAFPRPTPVVQGHWTTKTDVPHVASQNLKTYTIHAVVRPKAAMTVFSPSLVKNYTYYLYAAVKGHCGDGAIMAGIGSTNRVCVNQPLLPGEWTAITATYDGTTLTVYRKGVAVGSMASPPPADSTEPMQIGGSKFNEVCNCDQEVWLYDQALTAAEVAKLPSTSVIAPPLDLPPQPPTNLKLSERPSAGTAVLAWVQPGGVPDSYQIDYFKGTAWALDSRVAGDQLQASVVLPQVGRRTYRICAVSQGTPLCNQREGIWLTR